LYKKYSILYIYNIRITIAVENVTNKKPVFLSGNEPFFCICTGQCPETVSKKVCSCSSVSRSLRRPRTHLHACRGYRLILTTSFRRTYY